MPTASPEPRTTTGDYGIRIYVKKGNQTRLVKVGPAETDERQVAEQGTEKGPGVTAQSFGLTPQAGTQLDLSTDSGTVILLKGAAMECGIAPQAATGAPVLSSPWAEGKFFIFSESPTTCDQSLRMQELLLCMADKLSEIAETPNQVAWTIPPNQDIAPTLEGVWLIPPQSSEDRFIVRDLAINLLGHLVAFDSLKIPNPRQDLIPTTCTDLYGYVTASAADWTDGQLDSVLGCGTASYLGCNLPPRETLDKNDDDQVRIHASERLSYKTFLLRSAGRLLERLVHDSVDADLAGAEARRGRAGDPEIGAAEYWGVKRATKPGSMLPDAEPDAGDAGTQLPTIELGDPYNSLAHAMRVVSGRWEMGSTGKPLTQTLSLYGKDPKPGGISALHGLTGAYGRGVRIRSTTESVDSSCRVDASRIVEQSGMVLPEQQLDTLPGTTIKGILASQLIRSAAADNGLLSQLSAFTAGDQAKAIQAVVEGMSDEDVRFGLRRASQVYRLATGYDGTNLGVPPVVGAALRPSPEIASGVTEHNGVVFAKGLPRKDAVADPVAAAGGVLEVAQGTLAYDSSNVTGGIYESADDTVGNARYAFQDSYSMGQALMRRLVVLREKSVDLGEKKSRDFGEVAHAAVAENASWAGHARIVAKAGQSSISLTLIGFEPSDFGVTTADEISGQIRVIWGNQATAECAAGLRSTCMANPKSLLVAPTTPEPGDVVPLNGDLSSTRAARRAVGAFGAYIALSFPFASTSMMLRPERSVLQSDDHLYVVQLHDPETPSRSKILGTVALRSIGESTVLSISNDRDKQIGKIIGPSVSAVAKPIGVGERDLSFTGLYCLGDKAIEGWVPVESELTSNGDEYENLWRHYISLAKEAAAKADELGQKLIDQKLQQEFRKEAAQEELSTLCGGYGILDGFQVANGDVHSGVKTTDEALSSCLNDPQTEVVFLTEDQSKGKTVEDRTGFLKTVLNCAKFPTHPTCAKLNGSTPGEVTSDGLGLAESYAASTKGGNCQKVLGLVQSLATGFDGNAGLSVPAQPWMNPTRIGAEVRNLRIRGFRASDTSLVEDWQVLYGNTVLMDTRLPQDIEAVKGYVYDADGNRQEPLRWPGCARPNAQESCDFNNGGRVYRFDQAFHKGLAGAFVEAGLMEYSELELIRWRVEGALWVLAAISGEIPAGMFTKDIPVADFSNAPPSGATANVLAIYGTSILAADDTDPSIRHLSSVNARFQDAVDQNALGPVRYRAAYTFYPDSHQEIPTFLSQLSLADYRVSATNRAIKTRYSIENSNAVHRVAFAINALHALKCEENGLPLYAGPGVFPGPDDDHGPEIELSSAKSTILGDPATEMNYPHEIAWEGTSVGMCAQPKPTRGSVLTMHSHSWNNVMSWNRFPNLVDVALPFLGFRNNVNGYDTDPSPLSDLLAGYPLPGEDVIEWSGYRNYDAEEDWLAYPNADSKDIFEADSERYLLPRACGPAERVPAFVNSYAPIGRCGAAAQLSQAIVIGCEISQGDPDTITSTPPSISSVQDLAAIESWVRGLSVKARWVMSRIYLENIPKRVIGDILSGQVGTGNSEGEHGRLGLQFASELIRLKNSWQSVGANLEMVSAALRGARLSIEGAELEKDEALKRYTIDTLRVQLEKSQSAHSMIAAWMPSFPLGGQGGSWNPLGAAVALAGHLEANDYRNQELKAIEGLKDIANESEANRVGTALLELHQSTVSLHQNIENSLSEIQVSATNLLSLASQLRQSEAKARYEVAKGLAEDFYIASDGKTVVDLPVNRVLKREYDVTSRRYATALKQAKYLAYLARLAIEQRIGARLTTFDSRIGMLEPPATWADQVCEVQGVNYATLSRGFDADGGVQVANMGEFADQFIGDYVSKLEQFIEYYNLTYPSQDGNDTTILSLKADLLPSQGPCLRESPNLLYYSDDLTASMPLSSEVRGWRVKPCDTWDTRCLSVLRSDTLPVPSAGEPPNAPPAGQLGGGVTWLREYELGNPHAGEDSGAAGSGGGSGAAGATGAGGDLGGAGNASAQQDPVMAGAKSRSVWQTVRLEPGDYVLSWYHQARSSSGHVIQPQAARLVVRVFREDWSDADQTMPESDQPHVVPCTDGQAGSVTCSQSDLWARDKLWVKVNEDGLYHVSFSASSPGDGLGSVAISNVQLERVPSSKVGPFDYYGTNSSREFLSQDCRDRSASDVQAAFTHKCDGGTGECYYELQTPIFIDTRASSEKCGIRYVESPVRRKFARGNFNFRHITAGVNLVGTGLRDCKNEETASCYGTGYVEYTLEHDANQVGILGPKGDTQTFDFGTIGINHGKALAAERYITMPLSSADQGLLSQAGVEKTEFRGRPVEGAYRLRVWDSPALQWNKLEDVQIILKYRYWSPVTK